jgi:hypothetical protein
MSNIEQRMSNIEVPKRLKQDFYFCFYLFLDFDILCLVFDIFLIKKGRRGLELRRPCFLDIFLVLPNLFGKK